MNIQEAADRPFDKIAALAAFEACRRTGTDEDRSHALELLVPLVSLIHSDRNRAAGGCLQSDRDDLVEDVATHLWTALGRVTVDFENASHFRGYFASAIRNRLHTEIDRLDDARSIPEDYVPPPRFREGSIAAVEDRIDIDEALLGLELRVLRISRFKGKPKFQAGIQYIVRCYLLLKSPSLLYLKQVIGVNKPRFCVDYARVRCRIDLYDVWVSHDRSMPDHPAIPFIFHHSNPKRGSVGAFKLADWLFRPTPWWIRGVPPPPHIQRLLRLADRYPTVPAP